MRFSEFSEAFGVGLITAQNTTADVKPGETQRQARKWGFKVDKKGKPPTLRKKTRGSTTNVLYNLGKVKEEIESDLNENALKALRFATAAHKGQMRKSGDPYISHPKEVARFVKQFKQSNNLSALIQAAYLHDTIEDTDTTHEDLVKQFGGLVADMVQELTSDKEAIQALGKGEYIAGKMAKMSSWALVVKLADRLANVQDIDSRPPEFQRRYAAQTKQAIDRLRSDRYLSATHNKIISAIEDKIKEYLEPEVAENFADGKVNEAIEPNFDFEWDEAKRYPEFERLGKDAWIKLAKTGKLVKIKTAKDINNTDAGSPESFYNLDKNKQKRVLQQIARGDIEPPIVAHYSDGYKELIAGNTRLTAMMLRKGSATVWQFEVPDEVAELAENFADGKRKGKSRPGRVKKAGASCKGSVSSLRAKAKKYSGERGKMYHWCANMKGGKK